MSLACFSPRKKQEEDMEGEGGDLQQQQQHDLEAFREKGQAELRAMLAEVRGVDWNAVVHKAKELQEQEQAWLKKQEDEDRYEYEKRALNRRKQYDKSGSFWVNMMTYRPRQPEESFSGGGGHTQQRDDNEVSHGMLINSKTKKRWMRTGSRSGSTYSSLDQVSYSSLSTATGGGGGADKCRSIKSTGS